MLTCDHSLLQVRIVTNFLFLYSLTTVHAVYNYSLLESEVRGQHLGGHRVVGGTLREKGLFGNLRRDNGVTVVLQWCYSGVTVVLQWCYSGVTVVLQWCYSGVTVVHALLSTTRVKSK
jgi:hypothetical protein